jgi:protein-S-isoprenylcysteine O-methyltransferase Ste14
MTTISAAGRNPTTPRMKSRLHRLRAARGYGLAVRVLGSTWFLTLALLTTQRTYSYAEALRIGDTSPAGWSALLAALCLTVFYLALCWLIILRPSPTACDDYVLPSFIAFVGTYLPWTIVFFAPIGASDSQNLASAALLLIGSVLMAFAIFHLGRCFSIVPQARTLVRAGPYKLVRNPLYLAEEVAILGTLLQFYSSTTLAIFLLHGALQVRRIFYEENLLRLTFPDYASYAETTPRLIPYIW